MNTIEKYRGRIEMLTKLIRGINSRFLIKELANELDRLTGDCWACDNTYHLLNLTPENLLELAEMREKGFVSLQKKIKSVLIMEAIGND